MKFYLKKSFLVLINLIILFTTACSQNESFFINASKTRPATPGAATILSGNGELTLNWSSVQGAEQYEVWCSSTNEKSTAKLFKGDGDLSDTTATISGLTNGDTCFIWIKAKNSVGESDLGPMASAAPVDSSITPPSIPAGLTLSVDDSLIDASWSTASGADKYEVWFGTSSNVSNAQYFISEADQTDLQCQVTGLQNKQTYYVWVRAKNGGGVSDFSTASSIIVYNPNIVPDQPDSISLTPENQQLTVEWDPVIGAIDYEVYYNTTNNQSSSTKVTSAMDPNITDTTAVITGLTNGTTYYIWVRARNPIGFSDYSDVRYSVVNPPAPPKVTGVTLVEKIGKISVSWNAVSGSVNYYEVIYSINSASGAKTTLTTADGSTLSMDITGLANNNIYFILIKAVNDGGAGAGSDVLSLPLLLDQKAYLKAINSKSYDKFGSSVAIDGDRMVVGAFFEQGNSDVINGSTFPTSASSPFGAAYVYEKNGSTGDWEVKAYLKAPNREASDYFGQTVAISGDHIVVGAEREDNSNGGVQTSISSDDPGKSESGAVYVYQRNGAGLWEYKAYLKADTPEQDDCFGRSLAIENGKIFVGLYSDDNGTNSGGVYVFSGSGSSWSKDQYIVSPNPGSNDTFGHSLSVSGDNLIIGAPGEAGTIKNSSGAVNSSTLAAGTDYDDGGSGNGAAYIYKFTSGSWGLVSYLKATDGASGDQFGTAVSISGNRAVIGAPSKDSDTGAVYSYRNTGGTSWESDQSISVSSAGAARNFGLSVAIDGDVFVAGSSTEETAFVFTRSGGTWGETARLRSETENSGDKFSISLAISGDTILIGSPFEDNDGKTDNGAAYIFGP